MCMYERCGSRRSGSSHVIGGSGDKHPGRDRRGISVIRSYVRNPTEEDLPTFQLRSNDRALATIEIPDDDVISRMASDQMTVG
jgi:hypothetical protein